jgi:GNAT superfamily N-acetyltransferase
MLVAAATWRAAPTDEAPPAAEVLAAPQVADYIDGWGRPGNGGVIAEWDGTAVGACWFRRFTTAQPGFAFLGEDVPGIGIAVREGFRGRGIGTRLLSAGLGMMHGAGVAAASLSVELANERTGRLCERAGFEPVGREGGLVTMRLGLRRQR